MYTDCQFFFFFQLPLPHPLTCHPEPPSRTSLYVLADKKNLWKSTLAYFSGLNGNQVAFEEDGDAPPNYKILNFRKTNSGAYGYVEVGSYNLNKLHLNADLIRFPRSSSATSPEIPTAEVADSAHNVMGKQTEYVGEKNERIESDTDIPVSICSPECPVGQVKIIQNLVSSIQF